MSIFRPSHLTSETSYSAEPLPAAADDAVLRATGVLSLLAIGAIHFLQIVDTFKATPLLGVAFLVLVASCLAGAARLAAGSDSRAWAAAGIVGVAAIGGYIFTRLLSSPLDNQDVGNWSEMLGLAALFVETSLVAVSGYAVAATRLGRRAPAPASIDVRARLGGAEASTAA